eukprot:683146-Prorocentrum_minimum.AAC.1
MTFTPDTSNRLRSSQVPILQANKQAHKWDQFVMPVVTGKTIGFLGFGDIAKATARMAKAAFGMKTYALRRNAGKSQARSPPHLTSSFVISSIDAPSPPASVGASAIQQRLVSEVIMSECERKHRETSRGLV